MRAKPTARDGKRRLLLADDHPLVRDWAANVIDGQPDLALCGTSGTAEELLSAIRELNPDLVVVDITIPGSPGIELIREIHRISKSTAVLVLSNVDEALYAPKVVNAGAMAFVHKRDATTDLVPAIHAVLRGRLHLSERLLCESLAQIRGLHRKAGLAALSSRELEVFRSLGQGLGTRAIAEQHHISIKTVQMYCARIKAKLRLTNGSHLVRTATLWWESHKND